MNKRQAETQKALLENEAALIRRLKREYKAALEEINRKAARLQTQINQLTTQAGTVSDPNELARLQSMIQSKVYQKQYQEALRTQINSILDAMHVNNFTSIAAYLQTCYENGFIGSMYDLHGQGIPLILPMEQPNVVQAVQLDSKISHGLYSRLGEDISALKDKIRSELSRGIASGMSYQQIAQQLAAHSRIGYNNAIRIVRTEGHRIQCRSALDAINNAVENGANVVKQWDSTLDGRTRPSHRMMDGEIASPRRRFSNDLMYPGDPSGAPEEVCNCRCALLQRARWALDQDELDILKERAEIFGLDKSENFADFKKKYLKAAEAVAKNGRSGIIGITNIGRSVGAKAKNFDVRLPSGDFVHLAEGTRIYSTKVIAGKGRERQIDIEDVLIDKYGGNAGQWQKIKGFGYIEDEYGEYQKVELHWYECGDSDKYDMKIKVQPDGEWYIYED